METWTKNKDNRFDIDLKVGEMYEDSLAQILKLGKVEVKTEIDKWRDTGNIAIEIRCYGKKSGLSVTQAEHWAHILSYKGNIKSVLMFPVGELKSIVKRLFSTGDARLVMGGDNDESEMVLLPLKKIMEVI